MAFSAPTVVYDGVYTKEVTMTSPDVDAAGTTLAVTFAGAAMTDLPAYAGRIRIWYIVAASAVANYSTQYMLSGLTTAGFTITKLEGGGASGGTHTLRIFIEATHPVKS